MVTRPSKREREAFAAGYRLAHKRMSADLERLRIDFHRQIDDLKDEFAALTQFLELLRRQKPNPAPSERVTWQ